MSRHTLKLAAALLFEPHHSLIVIFHHDCDANLIHINMRKVTLNFRTYKHAKSDYMKS